MAASGLSNRKIKTAVSPRPKVNAYMYSMLSVGLLEDTEQFRQTSGPVGHFHRHYFRDVDDVARFLEEGAHPSPNRKR